MKIQMSKSQSGVQVSKIVQESDLQISTVHNEKWLSNRISNPLVQKSGLALAGYSGYTNKKSLQIFGKTEIGYLLSLKGVELEKRLKHYFSLKIPAVICSCEQKPSESILTQAAKYKTPVLISELTTSLLMSRVSKFLFGNFSQTVRLNGVLMEIMGMGVMITGDSGIGKSETALDLINRGFHLVSDDLVEFYLNSNGDPVGRSIEKIKNWLEVRGLGIINIVDVFGGGSVLDEKKLDLVIHLERWTNRKKYDRLGEEHLYFKVLGKDLPMLVFPVAPGRDLATLIEVSVRYFIARKNGCKTFIEHIYNEEN